MKDFFRPLILALVVIPVLLFRQANLFATGLIVNPQQLILQQNWYPQLSASSSFSQQTGNLDLIAFDLGITAQYASTEHLALFIGELSYAEQSGKKYVNQTMEHFRYVNRVNRIFFWEVIGQHQYHEFRRIDLRALGGTGPRLNFFFGKTFDLAIGSSYLYEYNRNSKGEYSDSGNKRFLHRWSNYLHVDIKFSESMNLNSTFYWQPSFQEFEDYRLYYNINLSMKFNELLSFDINGGVIYDNRPPETVECRDTVLKTTITLKLAGKKPGS